MVRRTVFLIAVLSLSSTGWELPDPGTHGHYLVLSAKTDAPPPFAAVDFIYGPREKVGDREYQWWQLEVRAGADFQSTPLLQLRALTSRDPLARSDAPLQFQRYILRTLDPAETLDYRDAHTSAALLPPWRDFERGFIPHPAKGANLQQAVPETLEYLGHILTLQHAGRNVPWPSWDNMQYPDRKGGAKILPLDRELLVGTGRNFKDAERRRLPQEPKRQNYTYVPFTGDDYTTMIEAGINLFAIALDQERFVRAQPVFYLRETDRNAPISYPAYLYRSNYLGLQMFMDEPSILMVGDKNINTKLRYFSDAAALLEKRVRERYEGRGSYGAFQLESGLEVQGINLGDMRVEQCDYPSWETLYETTFYQMAGGLAGLVHEGRYQLEPFNKAMARWTGVERAYTARDLLRYHYAFLRGGTRPFRKHWGTAVYGQMDPKIAPEAVTLAYDMGARYVWFWTSDHDHHVPWPEQLALARTLKEHASRHPRPSLFGPPPELDTAIVIPYGYFLSFENLWWVRVLDKEGQNEASQKYRRLMKRAHDAVREALDRGEDFDITVDDGREIKSYRRVVRVSDEE
jgi:hypothetical protein